LLLSIFSLYFLIHLIYPFLFFYSISTANAIKYTKEGRIDIEVLEGESDANTQSVSFSVSDTGMGMTEEQIALAMIPFSSTSKTGSLNLSFIFFCVILN